MEVFAGFGEQTDHEVGRLVEALQDMGVFDNTLFIYIAGDNGASAEGGPDGTYNETLALNGIVSDVSSQLGHIDEWGSANTFPHFSVGWAHATDTPFQWTKQVASHFGGTRNGMVMHWPARIKDARGGVRSQFHHVIDLAPTVLDAADLPEPTSVNGTVQRPMDGVSMLYTIDSASAPGHRTTQYFEMFGNRAIYHDGWVAATRHSIPWLMVKNPPLADDRWELYHVEEDFSQSHDLAAENPAKLKALQGLFMQEAERNYVLPIDDRRAERFDPSIAGRPDLLGGRTAMTLYEGMTGIAPSAFINTMRRSYSITAEVEVPRGGANGVIIANGGRFGGWSLYMKNGRAHEVYNFGGLQRTTVSSPSAVAPGRHTIAYAFTYDGGAPGSGGMSRLSVDGKQVGEARVPRTLPFFMSEEGADVGVDNELPVTEDYAQGNNRFTGQIIKVTLDAPPPVQAAK
jgi:arylsulfatase